MSCIADYSAAVAAQFDVQKILFFQLICIIFFHMKFEFVLHMKLVFPDRRYGQAARRILAHVVL